MDIAARLARNSGTQGDLVDGKGVGQPFKLTGRKGNDAQDFSEWDHKFRIYATAKFGKELGDVLTWAKRQKKAIVARVCDRNRQVSFEEEFGDGADDIHRIDDLETKCVALYA